MKALLAKIFGGSSKECCKVEIKEIDPSQGKAEDGSCCGANTGNSTEEAKPGEK